MKSNIVLQDVLAKINGSRILRKEDLSKALKDVNEIVSEVVDFAEKCEKRFLSIFFHHFSQSRLLAKKVTNLKR